jgi:prepilin-type N-terminal cleavage/methylation domain-containing protein
MMLGADKNQVCSRNAGFTMIELIMVIMVFGILSVMVLPRFSGKVFEERGFHDAVKSVLQHARHIAVGSRRFVCVDINAGTGVVAISRDIGVPEGKTSISCNTPIALPSPGANCAGTNQVCAPADVAITSNTARLIFDPLGRMVSSPGVPGTAAIITISDQPNITVVPETGYIE